MAAFTSVAAGVGLAVTAATTAASFAQAAEQNEAKRRAEESAAKAMMEARKKLDVNYYEQLSIQKEPYELARRELLSQGALATQQLAEGDARALAAGVGRVQLAQQLGQEKVATAMQQEKAALDKLVAGEESRLRDLGTQLDLQEVVGAQQAMSDAARAESMAIQQGMAGVTSLAGQVASLAPLYSKTEGAKSFNRLEKAYGQAKGGASSQEFMKAVDPSSLSLNQSQQQILKKAGSIGAMDANQYRDFMSQMSGSFNRSVMLDAGVAPAKAYQTPVDVFGPQNQRTKAMQKRFPESNLKYTVPDEFKVGKGFYGEPLPSYLLPLNDPSSLMQYTNVTDPFGLIDMPSNQPLPSYLKQYNDPIDPFGLY